MTPDQLQLLDCLTNDAWLDGYECGQRSRPTDAEIQAWGQEIRENAYRRGLHDGWGELIDAHQQWAHLLAVMNRHQLDRDNSTSYIPRRPDGVGALSQNEIAERAGVSQQYVGKVLDDPEVTTGCNLPGARRRGAEVAPGLEIGTRGSDLGLGWVGPGALNPVKVLDDPEVTTGCNLPEERQGRDGKVYKASRPAVVTAKDETEAARAQQRRVTA